MEPCAPYDVMDRGGGIPLYTIGGLCPVCGYDRWLSYFRDAKRRLTLETCVSCGFAGGVSYRNRDAPSSLKKAEVWTELGAIFALKLERLGLPPGREGIRRFVQTHPVGNPTWPTILGYTPKDVLEEIGGQMNDAEDKPEVKLLGSKLKLIPRH